MHCTAPTLRAFYLTLPLVLLLALSGSARAAAPSCDEDPTCQQLAAEGLEHFGAGRFAEAQKSYERAFALRADPTLLYNLARATHKAGRLAEAESYYQRFLAAGAAGDPAQQQKAAQYLAEVRKTLAPPIQPNPLVSTPATTPSPEPARGPLYRKPWLWAVVGVVVAGTAVGLGVGLAARRPDLSNAEEYRFPSN